MSDPKHPSPSVLKPAASKFGFNPTSRRDSPKPAPSPPPATPESASTAPFRPPLPVRVPASTGIRLALRTGAGSADLLKRYGINQPTMVRLCRDGVEVSRRDYADRSQALEDATKFLANLQPEIDFDAVGFQVVHNGEYGGRAGTDFRQMERDYLAWSWHPSRGSI